MCCFNALIRNTHLCSFELILKKKALCNFTIIRKKTDGKLYCVYKSTSSCAFEGKGLGSLHFHPRKKHPPSMNERKLTRDNNLYPQPSKHLGKFYFAIILIVIGRASYSLFCKVLFDPLWLQLQDVHQPFCYHFLLNYPFFLLSPILGSLKINLKKLELECDVLLF